MSKTPVKVHAAEAETGASEAPKSKAKVKAKANGVAKPPRVKATAKAEKPVSKPPKVKAAPAKPRKAVDLTKLDGFGFRLASLKSQAAAMFARKQGATLGEVRDALQSTQFNLLTQAKTRGFKVDEKLEDGNGNRRITRYFLSAKK